MDSIAYPTDTPNNNRSPHILGIPVEIAFAICTLLVAANLIYLDIVVVSQLGKSKETAASSIQSAPTLASNISCPQSCLNKIQEIKATTSTLATISITPAPTNSPTPTPTIKITPSEVREFFVPFGSGSGSSSDWTDIPGLSAYIDTTNYAHIKTVTFEATIRIPTGNQIAYIRLYNVTDKHPVWYSDVSVEGGTAKLVVSQPVVLGTGNKLYQIQIKTSLGFLSFLDQSRLRIIIQ